MLKLVQGKENKTENCHLLLSLLSLLNFPRGGKSQERPKVNCQRVNENSGLSNNLAASQPRKMHNLCYNHFFKLKGREWHSVCVLKEGNLGPDIVGLVVYLPSCCTFLCRYLYSKPLPLTPNDDLAASRPRFSCI